MIMKTKHGMIMKTKHGMIMKIKKWNDNEN